MKNLNLLVVLTLTSLLQHIFVVGQSTPTLCNESNQGSCFCGSGDIKTYVFYPKTYQRCIHTYIPDGDGPFPVLIQVDGYGQGGIDPDPDVEDGPISNANYYGFAIIGIGTTGPNDGVYNFGLEFPADGVVNPNNPTPCSDSDSRDHSYIKQTLDFIRDGFGGKLDHTKVYVEGFSQSSMYAAYISVCFADRIVGLWQAGSALSKTYYTPITPGAQGQCKLADFLDSGFSCCSAKFCENCTWWPIYPKTCGNKLVDCIATYTNDDIACGQDMYMYEAMVTEGNDARMLSFAPSGEYGGHANPANFFHWMVGCLGIVSSCSSACETSFLACSNGGVDEFIRCQQSLANGSLNNCVVGCAPTLEMLKTSQSPVVSLSSGTFGTQTGLPASGANPTRPNCNLDFGSFDVAPSDNCLPPNGSGPADGDIEPCDSTPAPTPSAPTTPSPTAAPTVAPTVAPTDPTAAPTAAPTPNEGSCVNPGSNCFKKHKRPSCDDKGCAQKVCDEMPECCKRPPGFAPKCRKKAKELCTVCDCGEEDDFDAIFFLKRKKRNRNEAIFKTCGWLFDQNKKRRRSFCRKFGRFKGNLPARFVCPLICDLHPCFW